MNMHIITKIYYGYYMWAENKFVAILYVNIVYLKDVFGMLWMSVLCLKSNLRFKTTHLALQQLWFLSINHHFICDIW